ncbi:MAG: hypothetical protein MZV64_73330 [Ignavibacteriales bacterium]|nr:hypothetical protein [Ignavibacteriales bacterium]
MARKTTDKPRRQGRRGRGAAARRRRAGSRAEGGIRPWHLLLAGHGDRHRGRASSPRTGTLDGQHGRRRRRDRHRRAGSRPAAARTAGAAGRPRDGRADRDGRRAHAGRPRAREDARAALDQGSGVRPRDGQDLRRRLPARWRRGCARGRPACCGSSTPTARATAR